MVNQKDKIQYQHTLFLTGDSSWGYDLFCGWKQGLIWGEKLSEKESVKQTSVSGAYSIPFENCSTLG